MEISKKYEAIIKKQLGDSRISRKQLIDLILMGIKAASIYTSEEVLVTNIVKFAYGGETPDYDKTRIIEWLNLYYSDDKKDIINYQVVFYNYLTSYTTLNVFRENGECFNVSLDLTTFEKND